MWFCPNNSLFRNVCYLKSTNTCLQSVRAFPVLSSSSWLLCPLMQGTYCSLHYCNADCKGKGLRGSRNPNLWSRVTSALSYHFNGPWHYNGSVPARIKELFVSDTWLLWPSHKQPWWIPEAFGTEMFISLVPKQTRRASLHRTLKWMLLSCHCTDDERTISGCCM